MNQDLETRTAAQVTGADALFFQVLRAVAARVRTEAVALEPATRDRLAQALMALQPEFRSAYEALFVEHMGAALAPEVLSQLQAEPLQRYLRARAAMSAELDRGFQELLGRMAKIDL
jgi:hypothetical protein